MARRSLGDDVKARVKRLFEALLDYVDDEFEDGDKLGIDFNWQSETQLVIRTKRRYLEELTAKDKYEGQLTQAQVREALKRLEDYLKVLEDNRTSIRGSEDWHFTLKLWHKHKEANLRQFDIEWENKRPPKSQVIAKKIKLQIHDLTATSTDLKTVEGESKSVANNIPPSGAKEFVGRTEELLKVHQLLQENKQVGIAAVAGMGGVGKTELATQYARQYLSSYAGGVCWLSAQGNTGTGIIRFFQLKFEIDPPQDWELTEQLEFCWEKWHPGNVLIVLDDVTDYKQQVKPYLPPPELSRFKVLLTTRVQFGSSLPQLRLDVLKPLAAMKLLESIIGRERLKREAWVARKLCEWLGYLPLGLELVGRYLDQQPNLLLEKLLARLERKRLEHEAIQKPDPLMRYELGVAAAFDLSWEQLDDNAQTIGAWLSLYALAPIPLSLEIEDDEEQETWEKALSDLISLHLLQHLGEETYRLHPLIRQFFQQKLNKSAEAEELKRQFAALMVAVAREIPQQPTCEDIINFSPVIPHIEEAANYLIEYINDEDLIWSFTGLGRFYNGQGFYQQAEPWLKQCVEVVKSRLGAEYPDVAASLNSLAGLYYSQGRYSEAEPLFLQALDIAQKSLTADHPQIAIGLNNLAGLYYSQGRYSEAEPLFLQALDIAQKSLPLNHPQIATHLNSLAGLYRSQGRYSEAEPLFLQALDIAQKSLHPDYPSIVIHLNSLALLYSDQGRYSEAEPLLLQSLDIDKKSLPPDHPQIATDLNNLSGLYYSQGRYSEAEPLLLQALDIAQKSLPTNHPQVATDLNNLAGLYYSQGRYSKAEPLFLQALDIDKKSLPPDHPQIAIHLNNLASLYKSQGRYGEAEPLFLQALDIDKKSLLPDHPQIATDLHNLAGLYYSQGCYGEAEPLLLQAIEICHRSLGDNHPNTVKFKGNFAIFLEARNVENRFNIEALREHPLGEQILAQLIAMMEESEDNSPG
ncbi:tetratricopeptide repeat protein [Coleofasciculus sp. FACHB-712]|uniref:tetratricopeptide repeat protein n=1 Tax=Coleofasciculus sp. FACHB-712 TaxID=2692789 RepID=UPI001689AC8D|nr:tetratricopeptide repeat protein [Coleofasciculus sp. FACHB-712]MBD1942100.1 tetratricopeptide repeat protein [Coleofasciculus sp. FACHB-712]